MDWKHFTIIGLVLLAALQADIIQSGDCVVDVKDQGGHHVYLIKGQYVASKYYGRY